MIRRAPLAKAVAAVGLLTATLAMAQSTSLSRDQRVSLFGGHHLAAGIYSISIGTSGLCLEQNLSPPWPATPHMVARPCNSGSKNQKFVLMPVTGDDNAYTIRPLKQIEAGRINYCATAATTAIGPSQINFAKCVGNGGGDLDQLVNIVATSAPGLSEIKQARISNPECWAMRGGSISDGSDVIKWACNGGQDQAFGVNYVGPVTDPLEALAFSFVRYQFASGIGYRRFSPTGGVDLPGNDLASFVTIEDSGQYCAQRCLGDASCKAFTWKAGGLDTPQPMCHLKNAAGSPVNRGIENLARIKSGILTP